VLSVTTGTVALGRYLITSTLPTGTTGVTSTGLNATTANASLGSFSSSNGLTLALTSGSSNFAGATASQTAGYTVSGTASSSGNLSGSFSSTVTSEFGSISPVVVNYTANPVDQRIFTTSTSSLALGYVHQGATVSGPSVGVTSTGLNATTANGTLGSFTGGPSGLGLGLTSGSAQFYGASASQTATYSISGTASTVGSLNGTYTSAVTAEFGSIPNVTVAVTGQVYSGQATWATNGGGNWGTFAGTGANAFGLNWGANQGSPGLDPSFTNTDTATFGSAVTSGTVAINTNGANISLKGMTFNNANASYSLYQTGGSGAIGLVGSGSNAASISVVAGDHAIRAGVTMGSSLGVDIAAGSSLTFHNALAGSSAYTLTKTGAGTLFMNGVSTFTGDTVVNAGTLSGNGSLAGNVVVHSGGTISAGADSAAYGVLTMGALTLDSGAAALLSVGGTASNLYDQIVSTSGTVGFGGDLTINLGSNSFTNGDVWQLFSGLSFSGNFASVKAEGAYGSLTFNNVGHGEWKATGGSLAAGQSMSFYVNNENIFQGKFAAGQLVIVPEPSAIVAAGIGLGLLGWRQLRRRRSRASGAPTAA
jgi:autotransporter-associated beta strand protein